MAQYTVSYAVTCYNDVTVERPDNMSAEEIIDSITRQEMADGQMTAEWEGCKDAWRTQTVSLIYDQDGNQVY